MIGRPYPFTSLNSGIKFQFHYGMIGSTSHYVMVKRADHVSIPLWDDWKSLCTYPTFQRNEFQFHYGMIGRCAVWLAINGLCEFQFHYGMIGSILRNYLHVVIHLFQFHYGMIGRRKWREVSRLDI